MESSIDLSRLWNNIAVKVYLVAAENYTSDRA
jgi:hypothetical protein